MLQCERQQPCAKVGNLSRIVRNCCFLPEAIDHYVGPDNPVRFIEAFVDGLGLAAAGFERVAAKETGRPGFDPAEYLNRLRSSRLEAEAHRNIEVIWLLRHLKPDFTHHPQ